MNDHLTLGEAKTLYLALDALAHGICWLQRSRDLIELSGTDAQTAASVHALAHAGQGLACELGRQLRALEQSPDAEVRVYVALLMDRFHATEPPAPHAETLDA